MKFGICGNVPWDGAPITELAKAAEALGYESFWMGEHIMLQAHIDTPFQSGGDFPEFYRHMPNPFIWLTAGATVTTKLKFGTNICLIPQRDPLILAKEVACLDRISNGRFIFGVGAGWIEEEAPIMGYPFNKRWNRTMECLRAMKKLWTEETPSFDGEYVSFPPVYCYPKPVQRPHPPILIGTGTPASNPIQGLKRVVEVGDGWMPVFLSPTQMTEELKKLKDLCAAAGRDYSTLDISVIVPAVNLGVGEKFASLGTYDATPRDPQELIAKYEDAGVTRILVGFPDHTREIGVKALEAAAKGLKLH